MVNLPIRPHLKHYRGAKLDLQRKANEENRLAETIAQYLNAEILKNEAEIQQHMFGNIALDLGCSVESVRSAISDGGYNGITISVSASDRDAIRRALSSGR